MHHYFSYIGVMTAGGAYTLKAATISALPFKQPDDYRPVIALVDKILEIKGGDHNADVKDLEGQIDKIIYNTYHLTSDEIEIVNQANE